MTERERAVLRDKIARAKLAQSTPSTARRSEIKEFKCPEDRLLHEVMLEAAKHQIRLGYCEDGAKHALERMERWNGSRRPPEDTA